MKKIANILFKGDILQSVKRHLLFLFPYTKPAEKTAGLSVA